MPRASSDAPARRSSRRAAASPAPSPAKRGAAKGKGKEKAAPAKGKGKGREKAKSKTPARRGSRRGQVEDDDEEEQEEEEQDEEEEEEEEEEEPQGGAGDDEDGSDDGGDEELKMAKVNKLPISKMAADVAGKLGRAEINRKASDLVRLALFTEYRRAPLRRDEITKKVLGKNAGKAFPVVFNKAARILRNTFGMELVELRAKGTESQAHLDQTSGKSQTQTQKGKKRARDQSDDDEAADPGKGEKSIMSHTYMLRSMLPPAFIHSLGSENGPLAAAAADTSVADGGTQRDPSGAMLDWKRADAQQGPMGLLTLLLSLILLNGRELPDDQLRAHLRRCSLDSDTPLPRALVPHASTLRSEAKLTLQTYLDQLVKQKYLERVRSNATLGGARTAEGASAGRRALATKKKRSGGEGGNEDDNFEWRWGARAEVEVGESSVAKFVGEVFHARPAGQEEPEESDEEQEEEEVAPRRGGRRGAAGPSQPQRRRVPSGQSQRAATQTQQHVVLLKEIERAAGSQLVD